MNFINLKQHISFINWVSGELSNYYMHFSVSKVETHLIAMMIGQADIRESAIVLQLQCFSEEENPVWIIENLLPRNFSVIKLI